MAVERKLAQKLWREPSSRWQITCFTALLLLFSACDQEAETVSKRGASCRSRSNGPSSSPGLSLYAMKDAAWPWKNGAYQVSVCWKPLELAGQKFPLAALAPDLNASMMRAKQWTRDIVEQEWNGKTNIRFTGWHDCSTAPADVSIVPISSEHETAFFGKGQSFVDGHGIFAKGKSMHLNVLFGDEFLYSSRYRATVSADEYDRSKDVYYFVPGTLDCFSKDSRDSLVPAWYPASPGPNKVNINAPEQTARFLSVFKRCHQINVLHEFGHIAGFLHEHLRADNTAEATACRNTFPADYPTIFAANRSNLPLGDYDLQSIMNYCRTTNTPTLSPGDIEMSAQIYPARAREGGC